MSLNHYATQTIEENVEMQYLMILFIQATETPINFIFGSIRYQNAPYWALWNIYPTKSILEYEYLKFDTKNKC